MKPKEAEALSTLREYLREYDTPVPDLNLRKLLRVKLAALMQEADSAPPAPNPLTAAITAAKFRAFYEDGLEADLFEMKPAAIYMQGRMDLIEELQQFNTTQQ